MSRTVILVEGPSDANAVTALAQGLEVDLDGVEIVDMGGITNVRRHLSALPGDVPVGVLHDVGEAGHVHRVVADLERPVRMFECDLDLEDELIRALGVARVVQIVEQAGDLPAWLTISRQPFHRDRPADQVLRRFFGAGSGRKKRYGALLAAALDASTAPRPLVEALRMVTDG